MSGMGILGGSFNPVHIGHLRVAEEVRQAFSLDKVLFIPTYVPPHKPAPSLLDYRHRKAMTALAIGNNPGFGLEDIEERLPAPSYSVRTMQALYEKYGSGEDLYFILGEDDFARIDSWHDPSLLFSLCNMVVVTRHAVLGNLEQLVPVDFKDKFWYEKSEGILMHTSGKKVYLLFLPVLDVSSSRIRSLVHDRRSIRYLTPDPVLEYIAKENLYHS